MVSSGTVIETDGLAKHYGKVTALDGLTIEVPSGVVAGFLGPNGAGKTTTIRVLMGLVKPQEGSATMLGVNVAQHTAEIRRRVGTLIEAPAFYSTHTGRTNLRIHARLAGVEEDRVDTVLEEVGLTKRAGSKYSTYSHGMKQRLGIACALLTEPELLILDEPTNGLDPAGIVEVRELVRGLAGDGRTVFVSSHLLAEVQQMCDYVIILNKGRQVASGHVSELVARGRQLAATVPEPARAADILAAAGFKAKADDGGQILIQGADGRGADVNRTLVEKGIYASQIVDRDPSLEQVFLELTDTVGEQSG